MDTRREVREIWKHLGRFGAEIGETILYYIFDAENSKYDPVYDEGYRKYHKARRIPVLWVDQSEAPEDYAAEGRRPTQRIRLAVSAQRLWEAGVSVTEVHGGRVSDARLSEIWTQDRVHDILFYDSRYYEISAFNIRGRLHGEDVIIGVTGIETYPSDDMIFDFPPGSTPPSGSGPAPLTGYGSSPYGTGPYGGTP